MNNPRLTLGLALLGSCLSVPALAAEASSSPEINSAKVAAPMVTKTKAGPTVQGNFVFSLFPKSMQSNPKTDLSAICEMTDEGRKRPLVTPSTPGYYISFDAGLLEAGEVESLHMPDKEALMKVLEKSLSQNGYKPAPKGTNPDYALIFHWGTHTRSALNDTLGDILSRAMLVGGRKFASELKDVLLEQSKNFESGVSENEDGTLSKLSHNVDNEQMAKAIGTGALAGEGDTQSAVGGSTAAGAAALFDSMSPLERYKRSDPRKEFLVEQTLGNIYFVVITALDPVAASKGKKVLLWRARMSVDSNGLSLVDAVPSMLLNSAPFLGRDMDEVATMNPNLMRGKDDIKIGESTVIEESKTAKPTKAK